MKKRLILLRSPLVRVSNGVHNHHVIAGCYGFVDSRRLVYRIDGAMTYVEQKIMIAIIAIVFYGMFQLLTSS